MEFLITGFILGLMGSLHCVGMCGPIALSLPLHGASLTEKIISGLLYNIGRTVMYGIMGALFGLLGQGFFLLGIQRWVSIVVGISMILSVLLPFVFQKFSISQMNNFNTFVRSSMQKLFKQASYKEYFFIGMLNSLLPCGLVYIAIVGAVAVGNVYMSSLYLLLFGLGTIPMMLTISVLGTIISQHTRNKINKLIPILVVFVGVLFILRGLCLGIPYVSPSKEKLETTMQYNMLDTGHKAEGSCCHTK